MHHYYKPSSKTYIYKFGRYLKIRYDNQPTQNQQQQDEETHEETENPPDSKEEITRNITIIQQETPILPKTKKTKKSKKTNKPSSTNITIIQEEPPPLPKKQNHKKKEKYKKTNIPTPENSEDEQILTSDTQSLTEDEQQTDTQSETEIQQETHVITPSRRTMNLPEKTPSPILCETPEHDQQSILWWISPLRDDDVQARYEINPNELFWLINKTEQNKYYEKKTKNHYGAPLLKDNERRARNYCRRTGQLKGL